MTTISRERRLEETSIVMISRETTSPTELRGVPMPAGARVSVILGSANRENAPTTTTSTAAPTITGLAFRSPKRLAALAA